MKITQLSKEQEEAMHIWKQKGIDIGLSTKRIDRNEAIKSIHELQELVLCKEKTPVIFLDNPIQAWIAVCMLSIKKNQVGDQVGDQVWAQVGDQVWDQVRDQVRDQVGDQVWAQVGAQVGDQVWDQVRDQVWDQVRAQVGDQVWDQVGAQVWDQVAAQVRDNMPSFISPYLCGSFDSYWINWADFYISNNIIKIPENLNRKFQVLKKVLDLGLIFPLENVCVVCEKPTAIHMKDGKLHNESGPSVEYNGAVKMWSLNGVRVSEYLVMTPEENLDIEYYNKENNADIRTEFVRKYGIDRMIDHGKLIDSYENYDHEWWSKSQYELYDMESLFEGVPHAPHLKMTNQTTGVYHVEPVHPDCKTIRDAVKDRFGGQELNILNIA